MRLILGLCLLLAPVAARAEWREASSAHFVVYADESDRDIRLFSDQLERYHAALDFMTGGGAPAPSPSNRVTVYVVKTEAQVRKLAGEGSAYLMGFYIPRAGRSLAIVPHITARKTVRLDLSMITLLHEYAHHFLISSSPFPYPRWMSEGGAEFYSSAAFGSDGSVDLGRPAMHRANELLFAPEVTAADLLDAAQYAKRKPRNYDAFYGKSWLLYHYLVFSESRSGQLENYLKLMAQGKSARDAAETAFGAFDQLERELESYMRQSKMKMVRIPPTSIAIGSVTVRVLRKGEAEIMPLLIQSKRGVNARQAKAILPDVQAVAARFPDDPTVLSALAEAEHDAGNDTAAIKAADAALAIDPANVNAHVQKGTSLFRIAEDADDKEAAYRVASAAFVKLNRLEPNHPLPLLYYYRGLVQRGKVPTPLAVQGLERAAELAPFDLGLRMTVAMQTLRDRRYADARRYFGPIAYNPHGGRLAEAAQAILARMDAEPGWDGADMPQADAVDIEEAEQ